MLGTRGVHNAERCTVSFIIASIQGFDSQSVYESIPWVFLPLYQMMTLRFILHNQILQPCFDRMLQSYWSIIYHLLFH